MLNLTGKWKNAVITGASSGIGLEFAQQLAANGVNLFLVARRYDILFAVKNELEYKYNINVYIMDLDLSSSNSVNEMMIFIKEIGFSPDLLINNAGAGIYGKFDKTDLDSEIEIINLNITSVTQLTKSFLQIMKNQGLGTILNVSSTMAFRKSPHWAVYSATKSYVFSFTRSLILENEKSPIHISLLCPGKTLTGFDVNANALSSSERKAAVTSKVVELALNDLANGKTMIIPGINNKVKYYMFKYLPDFLTDSIIRGI
jgi:short-subunit dehydrogenase